MTEAQGSGDAGHELHLFDDIQWDFRVEHKDIRVYSAPLEESGLLGFRGVVSFQADLKKLVGLFHDTDSYHRWVHQLSSMKLLERGEGLRYVMQQVINAPWPLPPREMIVRTSLAEAGEDAIAVFMISDPDFLPRDTRYCRVERTFGKWVFEPLENRSIRITFMMFVDPGPDIPASIANTAMFEVPFYSLQKLRRLAQDDSYQPAFPDEISRYLMIE
ncbi:hypothetical protein CR163_006905 [Prosthecochloris sp. ZM_2]|uniref:START domain-containing protein n=1 Tax=Prosthecochloris sp. ZM_2 TaxID=2045206 RepID=UPI000DF84DDB|nr:START domain-containing protein [Prosthecochloris sp. ZM_2]RNA64980.1 hypothetical protein CR163_006905 [Prosthecochloris sp. ZM_2]